MNPEKAITQGLIQEAQQRMCDESLSRIRRCLGKLTEQEIWRRPNSETVSIGNLVLHLCGNVRQWIISGLGGAPDNRDRPSEFSETGPIPTDELIAKLEGTLTEAMEVIRNVTPADLIRERPVQGFAVSGVSVLVHVIEHFSYHTGQITYAVKAGKGIDMAYYPDID